MLWRYELWGKSEKNGDRLNWFIIETAAGETGRFVGQLHHPVGHPAGERTSLNSSRASGRYRSRRVFSAGSKPYGEALAARENKVLADLYVWPWRRPPILPHHHRPGCRRCGAAMPGICACPICSASCATSRQRWSAGWRGPWRPGTPATQTELLSGGAAPGVRGRAAGGHRTLVAGACGRWLGRVRRPNLLASSLRVSLDGGPAQRVPRLLVRRRRRAYAARRALSEAAIRLLAMGIIVADEYCARIAAADEDRTTETQSIRRFPRSASVFSVPSW